MTRLRGSLRATSRAQNASAHRSISKLVQSARANGWYGLVLPPLIVDQMADSVVLHLVFVNLLDMFLTTGFTIHELSGRPVTDWAEQNLFATALLACCFLRGALPFRCLRFCRHDVP